MNLEADKAKRDARIKAKEERIKNSLGVVSEPTPLKTEEVKKEKVAKPKKVKEAK